MHCVSLYLPADGFPYNSDIFDMIKIGDGLGFPFFLGGIGEWGFLFKMGEDFGYIAVMLLPLQRGGHVLIDEMLIVIPPACRVGFPFEARHFPFL